MASESTTVTKDEKKEDQGKNNASLSPHSSFVNGLLTDLYQITMAYAYFKNNMTKSTAVFDLFFRKCPFKGEYCVFAGLEDVLRFLNTFKYTKQQVQLLAERFADWDPK